jgi:hypothetical protein
MFYFFCLKIKKPFPLGVRKAFILLKNFTSHPEGIIRRRTTLKISTIIARRDMIIFMEIKELINKNVAIGIINMKENPSVEKITLFFMLLMIVISKFFVSVKN